MLLRAIPERTLDLGTLNLSDPLIVLVVLAFRLNLLLMLFNLVPVPPLDGGNIVGAFLRGTLSQRYDALRPYGIFILYALMLSGTLGAIIGPPYTFLERLLTL